MTTPRTFVAVLLLAAVVCAQQPFLGRCPDHVPMSDFDLNKFMGVWYENERSFNLLESIGKCMLTNYTLGEGSKVIAHNHYTNLLTGVIRITEGEVRNIGKLGEGKLSVRYYRLPVPVDFSYTVLNTDYDDYAVLWNCVPFGGPFINAQNVWIMSRKRVPEGKIIQKAYGVLDKYQIQRTGFAKIDQKECTTDPVVEEVEEEVLTKSALPEPSKEMEPPKVVAEKVKEEIAVAPEKPVTIPFPAKPALSMQEPAKEPQAAAEKPAKQ